MPWWAWLVVAGVLLGSEVAVQTEFWLAVIGAAALIMSALLFVGWELAPWAQGLGFALLAVGLEVFVRRRIHEMFVGPAPGLAPELIGERATAIADIEPGGVGPVELRGSTWRGRNVGESPLSAGSSARVEAVDGLQLDVRGGSRDIEARRGT
jgi:membrane protein implicated in regulation of membrane protease activity